MTFTREQFGNPIDLVRTLIQFEGNYTFNHTDYDVLGGVCFTGCHNTTKNRASFVLDKGVVDSLKASKSLEEVIEIYRDIGFFAEPGESGGTGDETH